MGQLDGVVDLEIEGGNATASVDAFTSAEECNAIVESETRHWPQEEGDTVALIHSPWFDEWAVYANFKREENGEPDAIRSPLKIQRRSPRPGPIDNSPLLVEGTEELVGGLREGVGGFTVVNKETWELLHKWYGGGPEILRQCMTEGTAAGDRKVVAAVYFLHLKVHRSGGSDIAAITVSKQITIADLKLKACKALGLEEGDAHIWDYWSLSRHALLESRMDDTAQSAKIFDNQDILLEERVDGAFECEKEEGPLMLENSPVSPMYTAMTPASTTLSPGSYGRPTPSFNDDTMHMDGSRARGEAGLTNLGNTCFMNSSVQCLAHSVPIMREFLGGKYISELNRTNPLGRGGKLAEAFGGLMEKLWQGGVSSVTPRGFKAAIANFAPQFVGYSQHDSQELLAFLLDGLHEDLNRVAKKRYIEDRDYAGQPDEEWAAEAWENYRANNNSVIVDHFQGMYKSTLICPECDHCSVKFDPAMYLTLPLPVEKTRTAEVNIVHVDGSKAPALHAVDVPKSGTIGELYAALAQALSIPVEQAAMLLLVVEVWDKKIDKRFEDMDAPVSDALGGSGWRCSTPILIAYRFPSAELGPKSTTGGEVVVFHRKKRFAHSVPTLFAPPLLLWLPSEGVAQDLQSAEPAEVAKSHLSFGGPDNEFIVSGSSDVGAAIQAALRPLKRRKVEHTNGTMAAAEAAAIDDSAAVEDDMAEDIEDVAALPPQTPGRSAAAQAAAAAAEKRAAAAAANGTPAGAAAADGSDDGNTSVPPAEGEWEDVAAPPTGGPEAGAKGGSKVAAAATPNGVAGRPSTPAQPTQKPYSITSGEAPATVRSPQAAPSPEPFDMFASPASEADTKASRDGTRGAAADGLQNHAAANGAALTGRDDASGAEEAAAYTLTRALRSGEARFARGTPDSAAGLNGPPWYVAVDFEAGAEEDFDLAAMESPPQDASVAEARARRERGPPPIPLADCLQAHLQPEQLDKANSWYCPKCKQHQQATKKLDLWTLPEVLVVHLKRFAAGRLTRDKLDALVQFPLAGLDMSPYVLRPQVVSPIYDLYAVSNHFGGLGGGHYTAFVHMPSTADFTVGWYNFDDSRVSGPVPDSEIVSSSAYVLFYRRREEARKDDGADAIASALQPDGSPASQPAGGANGLPATSASPSVSTAPLPGDDGRRAADTDVAGGVTSGTVDSIEKHWGFATGPAGPALRLGGGTATGSSSSLENMGRSGSERGDPEDDMELDLKLAGGGGFDDFGGAAAAAGGLRDSGSDAWESVGASPGDEAATHAKKRQPLAELSGMQPAGGASAAGAYLGGSHLTKGSWTELTAADGGSTASLTAVNGGDFSDSDLYN